MTKKGTVDLEEKDLDNVAGGAVYLQFLTTNGLKMDGKIESLAQKVSPSTGKTTPNR